MNEEMSKCWSRSIYRTNGASSGESSPNLPNPSAPLTQKEAAAYAGMRPRMLARTMAAGAVRHRQLNRQLFIFCLDDLAGLPAARSNS